MGQAKTVHLIGNTDHKDVQTLMEKLKQAHVEVLIAKPGDTSKIVLLCLTEPKLSNDTCLTLDGYLCTTVLPVLFEGGVLPALYADIKPANLAKDPTRGFDSLLKAIHHFC